MPTKIISGASDPPNGEIKQDDLLQMMQDFKDDAEIISSSGRPIIKTDGINIPFWIFKKLIDDSFAEDGETDKYVSINFAITLPGQKSCGDEFMTDLSNYLTVVVNIAQKQTDANLVETMVERTDIDQGEIHHEIITLGFKTPAPESPLQPQGFAGGPLMLVAPPPPPDCCANPKKNVPKAP